MVTKVVLPKLGQTMEEGTIVEWFKKEGEPVKRGDLLFTVESDKATLEVEATARGFLRQILVPAGETRPVMTVVALMTRTADESLEGWEAERVAGSKVQRLESRDPTFKPSTFEPVTRRLFVSPRARMRAQERGVDLARVTGTGPNGRIVEQDVLAYVESQPKATPTAVKAAAALGVDIAALNGSGISGRITKRDVEAAAQAVVLPAEKPAVESVPLKGLRRVIAERMATSARTTARVTLVTEVDATALTQAREQLKASVTEEWGFAPGYNDLLGLIVARALREFPYMNARLSADGQAIEQLPAVNLGLAVNTERGLLVPVVRDADRKGHEPADPCLTT
jgi:pyruvate dehydrogenase E2 component (dihydrolipoamide acetyltransferase)